MFSATSSLSSKATLTQRRRRRRWPMMAGHRHNFIPSPLTVVAVNQHYFHCIHLPVFAFAIHCSTHYYFPYFALFHCSHCGTILLFCCFVVASFSIHKSASAFPLFVCTMFPQHWCRLQNATSIFRLPSAMGLILRRSRTRGRPESTSLF